MNKPKTRNENIVVQEIEKEILIYDLKEDKAFCLNETSAMIYQLCNGKNSVAEISQQLSRQSKQPINDEFIWLALDALKKDNLLENNEQFEINFNGLNRRQVIKKVGFASMIMLPLVSSIVAPSAANAQSGIALLAACPTGGGCQAGLTCTTCTEGTCSGGSQVCCKGSGTTAPGAVSPLLSGVGFAFNATTIAECNNVSDCVLCLEEGPAYCCSGQTRGLNSICICL